MKKRLLILEDGSVYEGIAAGADRYQMEADLPDRNMVRKLSPDLSCMDKSS